MKKTPKYVKELIEGLVCFINLYIIFEFITIGPEGKFYNDLIIGNNIFQQLSFIYIIILTLILCITYVSINIIPKFLISIHKKISFKPLYHVSASFEEFEYGSSRKIRFYRIIMVSLFGFNFSFGYASNYNIQSIVLNTEYLSSFTADIFNFQPFIFTFIVILLFFTLIASFIFCPIWFLKDSEIYFYKAKKNQKSIDISNLGDYYNRFIMGFIGIGLIASYISYFIQITTLWEDLDFWIITLTAIILPFLPLLMNFFVYEALFYLDHALEKRRAKLLDKLRTKKYFKEELINKIKDI